jgi:predicted dehydrogenase
MKKLLRGVLIGCGYASGFQLEAWKRVPQVEIVAVSSRDIENGCNRAAEFDIPQVYTDYVKMLDEEECDFVDISTPPIVHREMIQSAADRGLHVLCQKPIAETLAELRQMTAICERAGVRFMVNENGRFQPWFQKMKDLLDGGTFGTPHHANFSCHARMTLPKFDAGAQSNLFSKMPRLVTFELGVHYLDTLRFLFGEPHSLYAMMDQVGADIEGEDLATIAVRFPHLQAQVVMSWASVPPRQYARQASWGEYCVLAEKGTLLLEVDGTLTLRTDQADKVIQFPEESELLGYLGAQQHFADCMLSGAPFQTSGTETLKTMELVFGAYHSAAKNVPYHIGTDLEFLMPQPNEDIR